MRNLIHTTKKRLIPLLGASVLLTGGIGASVLFTGGTADAVTCASYTSVTPFTVPEGAPCTITGTLSMTAGALTLIPPPAVAWAETISGVDQLVTDPAPADETYTVDDATGTAPGWNVTASATAFTSAVGSHTLGTAGVTGATIPTFSTNGSITLAAGAVAAVAPSANCGVVAGVVSTCTLPTNVTIPTTYPVNISYGQLATPTPVRIYSADAGSGLGTIVIGYDAAATGTVNPVGWWLNVPSNTILGTYTSTITLELITAP